MIKKLLVLGGIAGIAYVVRKKLMEVAAETKAPAYSGNAEVTAQATHEGLDKVQQASEESFPASDAPSIR